MQHPVKTVPPTGAIILEYRNPEIPEGINTTETHPLKELIFLLAVVTAGAITITATLSMMIDWTADTIPFEFETALSQPLEAQLKSEPNEVDRYLQQLADSISPYMDLPGDVKIHVHYVNKDTVNAMATLGGHVIIYRGMLERLPDENTLVMLLGHEIAHIKLRHPIKALGKGIIISLALSAIMGQSSDSVVNVITDTSMLTLLSFSRDQEQASDEEGIKALNAFYGHVHGATELFEILQQAHQQNAIDIPQLLRSHPDTESRIERLNEIADTQGWTRHGATKAIPEKILRIIAGDKQRMSREVNLSTP
jgi:predicted Zn-dependent protease